jgi:two-component system, chemotaxis family, CheB/CheR fusion protein
VTGKPTRPKKRSVEPVKTPGASAASGKRPSGRLPIVGIGASAGGLEALEQFFSHVPKGSGIAFVVIQHLDPTRKGAMVELLQRGTAMTVVEARDRMRVARDRVYVIPSNHDLSMLHGVLHLLDPVAPRGLRLPIDHFFRSLAVDQRESAIGVVLSGMGSDGTGGLSAIKEHAGAAFVQSPDSAKFNGMPQSAIEAGLADVVASADELPGRIVDFLKSVHGRPGRVPTERDQSALDRIIIQLRAQTGHDFSVYRKSGLYRRIERRMGLHQLAKIADYARFLAANDHESNLLFKELLIGVTNFFREPEAWEHMKADALPGLLASRPKSSLLRAWVPACSTGEEAYSLAIVFRETLDKLKPAREVALQIFATDIDKDAIDRARAGFYPESISADVSPERLNRFFVKEERGYRVSSPVRETIIFAAHDLLMDPPFTRLDVISCRNLLIYIEPDLQKKLISLFHYCLTPGGVLLLGTAETAGPTARLFTPLNVKSRLYRRSALPAEPGGPELPPVFGRPMPAEVPIAARPVTAPSPTRSLKELADQLLLEFCTPAVVLVTRSGDVVYLGGKTGRYLEPAAGKSDWNILTMARRGLDVGLSEAFRSAVARNVPVAMTGMPTKIDGRTRAVDVTIRPLTEPPELQGMLLVVFADSPAPSSAHGRRPAARSARQAVLEDEFRHAREEAKAAREQMQTTQEELKSANEELQSANEELQSTNEELTTSKEEAQSMNEELQTLNQELQSKLDELTRTSDDMKNLLNSTNIATLFLDEQLKVRRFTTSAERIFRLLPADVGRPITDLASDLDYPALLDDIREVLRTLVPRDKSVATRDGRWYDVRVMPYRTQDSRIDGVVITFSPVRQLEAAQRTREAAGGPASEARSPKSNV